MAFGKLLNRAWHWKGSNLFKTIPYFEDYTFTFAIFLIGCKKDKSANFITKIWNEHSYNTLGMRFTQQFFCTSPREKFPFLTSLESYLHSKKFPPSYFRKKFIGPTNATLILLEPNKKNPRKLRRLQKPQRPKPMAMQKPSRMETARRRRKRSPRRKSQRRRKPTRRRRSPRRKRCQKRRRCQRSRRRRR